MQALWINALRSAAGFTEEFAGLLRTATASFADRFWNAEAGCLYDVVDVDHLAGTADSRFRPNQIFAVGGLPFALMDVEGEHARRIVDAVEARLLTPPRPRTLAPGDPTTTHYAGGVLERDGATTRDGVAPLPEPRRRAGSGRFRTRPATRPARFSRPDAH